MNTLKFSILLTVAFLAATFGLPDVSGANVHVEGAKFDRQFQLDDASLKLKGTGVIKYLGIFKVSAAAFYMPEWATPRDALADLPRRLEIEYLHAIKAKDFAESTRVWIRKNVTEAEYEALLPRIEQLNSLYEDVEPGDRYCLTYEPGLGTMLELNGVLKGRIEGADFGAALFSIWIGERPISNKLRDELLGIA